MQFENLKDALKWAQNRYGLPKVAEYLDIPQKSLENWLYGRRKAPKYVEKYILSTIGKWAAQAEYFDEIWAGGEKDE